MPRVMAPISLSDVRVQFIVTIIRMKVLTWYGREYHLASEPSSLNTPLHYSCRLQHGAAWTSMGGGDRRNSTDDAPSETWGTAGDRFTLKHVLLLALCSFVF